MKKLVSEPRSCLLSMLSLVFICELLLNTSNRLLQVLGIIILPVIITLSVKLVMGNNKLQNKKTIE